jgi:hypothetical protein
LLLSLGRRATMAMNPSIKSIPFSPYFPRALESLGKEKKKENKKKKQGEQMKM